MHKKIRLCLALIFLSCAQIGAWSLPFFGKFSLPSLKKILYTCFLNQEYTPAEIEQQLREVQTLSLAHENIQVMTRELCKKMGVDFARIKVLYNANSI